MQSLWKEVLHAARALRKSPVFALVGVLTLALGIGANTAIFTVVKGVLLDPLAYPEADRLMGVMEGNPEAGLPRFSASAPNFADFRDQNRVFTGLAAQSGGNFNYAEDGPPERFMGARVSGDYFRVFGVPALIGRTLSPEDDRPGGEKVVVLGHGLWQRRFGGGPDVLGRQLRLNGENHTIVGVMPPRFNDRRELFVPLALDYAAENRGSHSLMLFGRLKEGVSLEEARTEMSAIAARLEQAYPETNTGWITHVDPIRELMVGDIRPALLILLLAVAAVLLIACANVANLLLSRLAARERELSIRAALGASRRQLVVHLLIESVLLSIVGGSLGILLALVGTRALRSLGSQGLPRSAHIDIDGGVLLFTLALSLVTGLLFGLLPAWRASRPQMGEVMKESSRGQAGGLRGRRIRTALVLAQVAVAVTLLLGAGLLIRSFSRLVGVDPGFDPHGTLALELVLPESKYPNPEDQARFFGELFARLETVPGIESSGGVFPMPLTGRGFNLTFHVEGRPLPEPNKEPTSNIRVVSPGYFQTMRIPLRRGRVVEGGDTFDKPGVAVISESTAARFWAGEDPLGTRITFDNPESEEAAWLTVVGVVGDVRHEGLDAEISPEIYWPYLQMPIEWISLVLRTSIDPESLAGPVREAVRSIDPELPTFGIRTVERLVADSVARSRFSTSLLSLFAGLALLLAVIGVYALLSYSVTQRMREIGVRMALGASRDQVWRQIVRQGMAPVVAGLGLGLLLALVSSRILASLVYGISTRDPVTFVLVPLVLALVAALACWLPARRATRVDPMLVLREE